MIKATKFDIVIVLIILVLLSLGLFGLPFFMLTSAVMIFILLTIDKSTTGVFLIWFFFNLLTIWTSIYKINISGLIAYGLALICFYSASYNHKIKFSKHIALFLPICFLFFIFYCLGPMHSYSNDKMIFIIYKGIFFIICFIVLIVNPNINYIKLIVLILLSVYQYYSYTNIQLNWEGPLNFLDFGSYRIFYLSALDKMEDQLINYQEIGLSSVIAFAFLLNLMPTNKSLKLNNVFFYLGIVASVLFVLYSGSRQSLYSLPIIFFVYLFFEKRIDKKKTIQYLVISILAIFFFVDFVYDDKSVFKASDGDTLAEKIHRPFEIIHAADLIVQKPLLGHGLGGFTPYYNNQRYYPHNIFLELICETGIIGTLILIVYLISQMRMNKVLLSQKAKAKFLLFPVFIALLMRANLSSDLTETVYVFSFLIAWISLNNYNKKSTENANS
jgi:O-antigen ligase